MTINYQFPYYQPTSMPQQFPQQYPQQFPPLYQNQYPHQQPLPNYRGVEASYVENILRLNLGKTATIYMNFENSQWGSKVFKGEILGAGRDHILLRDNQTGVNYLLLRIYLSYITFDEDIEYEYPFM